MPLAFFGKAETQVQCTRPLSSSCDTNTTSFQMCMLQPVVRICTKFDAMDLRAHCVGSSPMPSHRCNVRTWTVWGLCTLNSKPINCQSKTTDMYTVLQLHHTKCRAWYLFCLCQSHSLCRESSPPSKLYHPHPRSHVSPFQRSTALLTPPLLPNTHSTTQHVTFHHAPSRPLETLSDYCSLIFAPPPPTPRPYTALLRR